MLVFLYANGRVLVVNVLPLIFWRTGNFVSLLVNELDFFLFLNSLCIQRHLHSFQYLDSLEHFSVFFFSIIDQVNICLLNLTLQLFRILRPVQ